MKEPGFATPQEREAFRQGLRAGERDGLRKAGLLIQLMANDTDSFKENILQNSKEAIELIKLMTGAE